MISGRGDFFLCKNHPYTSYPVQYIYLRLVESSTGTSTCVPTLTIVHCGKLSCGRDSRRVVRNPNIHTHRRMYKMVMIYKPCSVILLSSSTSDLCKGWKESILSSFSRSVVLMVCQVKVERLVCFIFCYTWFAPIPDSKANNEMVYSYPIFCRCSRIIPCVSDSNTDKDLGTVEACFSSLTSLFRSCSCTKSSTREGTRYKSKPRHYI